MSKKGKKPALDHANLFFREINRDLLPELLRKDGDFLLRRGGGGRVLSVNVQTRIVHFKFGLNEKVYSIKSRSFPSLELLLDYYYETERPLNPAASGYTRMAILKSPIYSTLALIDGDRVQFKEVLGKGNFGEVWKAFLLPEKEMVAIKILAGNTSEKERNECMAEAKLMSILSHENIVQLKGISFWRPDPSQQPRLLIVLEFCNYGALEKLLEKGFIENRGKVRALLDSARGIEYLHKKEVIHRDIASRNCLVHKLPNSNKFVTKIADFGLSRLAPEHYELATKRRLPVFSTAPDTIREREWTSASDVYSFGILMHEVYNQGKNPYEKHFLEQKTPMKEIMKAMDSGWRLPVPEGMPQELGELALRCLKKATERPSMSEIAQFIKQFYTGMCMP